MYPLLNHEKVGLNQMRLSLLMSGETIAWWDEDLDSDPVPIKKINPDRILAGDHRSPAPAPLLNMNHVPDQDRQTGLMQTGSDIIPNQVLVLHTDGVDTHLFVTETASTINWLNI